ncbi:MAG: methylated-DNA--[protein]-cysteine S-methyltransferase [Myxococcales bacterium]|nr:methylated-DNA--[protein]-cysteine S-methyltransferase [Myxococcales bacterium]
MSELAARLVPSALGAVGISWGKSGLRAVVLPHDSEAATARALRQRCGAPALAVQPSATSARGAEHPIDRVAARVARHLAGELDALDDVPLELDDVSPFARRVYQALRRVGPGAVTTYGDLARAAEAPVGAARAVGAAMGHNPLPLVVPCHRVLGKNDMGDFSSPGGLRTKLRLLTLERVDAAVLVERGVNALRADETLGPIIRRVGQCRIGERGAPDALTALSRSIVHQQVSLAAGRTIFGRLLSACGDGARTLDGDRVLAAAPEVLRGAGLSARKAETVREIAERYRGGEIDEQRLARLDDEQAIEALTNIKGVGRWTAEMFLMFQLARLDVLPLGDVGLQRAMQRAFGIKKKPAPRTMTRLAKPWTPFRSVGCWYLWRGLDGDLFSAM